MRTYNTLFLIQSVDGKISTGESDSRDIDKDFPKIPFLNDGFSQYYDLEKETDKVSFNSGKVMAKIGVNDKAPSNHKSETILVILDNKPHLTAQGLDYLSSSYAKLYLATNNKNHPVYLMANKGNIQIIEFTDLTSLFKLLKDTYKIDKVTIQSGGELNSSLIREGLVDELLLVIAPVLIGGRETPTIMDGLSLISDSDLNTLRTLELIEVKTLQHSYYQVRYRVINQ